MNSQRKLGKLIEDRRLAVGMSLRELARRIDVAPNTVRNIEHGAFRTSADKLFRISEALGLNSGELFELAEYDEESDIVEAMKHSLDVSGLSAAQLYRVQAYIDGLRGKV